MDKGPIIISNGFVIRNAIHKLHLQTTKYAEHVALNGYYDAIIPLLDTFAECYQGRFGIIENFPSVAEPKNLSAEDIITTFRDYLDDAREEFDNPELQNIIDEIQTLNNKTLYLLQLS